MTTLPLRPALADVLAVLTDTQPLQWSPESYRVTSVTSRWVGRRHPPRGMGVDGGVPLAITDPAEAFEALIARGVLPDACDVRRAWACDECNVTAGCARIQGSSFRHPHPSTIPALVAWASLGTAAILRAEELARATVAALRPWGAPQPERVVWRVGSWMSGGTHAGDVVWSRNSQRGVPPVEVTRGGISNNFRLGIVRSAADLWRMGLALDSVTADAVTVVVPPIGGGA